MRLGRLGAGLGGLAGTVGFPALVDGRAAVLGRATLGRGAAGLVAQTAQDLRGQLTGGQFGFARRGRTIGVDVLHEADGVPSPRASARGPTYKSAVGSSEFGDLALHGYDCLSLFHAEIESASPSLTSLPAQKDAWPTHGLIADLKVFIAAPDNLTDEALTHLNRITEVRLRPEAFGFGELAHALHVGAKEISDLCAYLEILFRETHIGIPSLSITEEL